MGLDGVELVLEVEDRFRIKLPDAECSRVRTVADLAALVISQLPVARAACPTARSFFRIRKHLVEHGGFHRRSLRPATSLEAAFPRPVRRQLWKLLADAEPYVPRLQLSKRASRSFDAIGLFLMISWAAGLVALTLEFGVWGGVLSASLLVGGIVVFCRVRDLWAIELPKSCETLGDLARENSPQVVPFDAGEQLVANLRVLEQIQTITANQLGLLREKVSPESRFVEDLGMD